jgi:hypothetical protein
VRHLVWLPAALLITAGVLSAIGVSLTPSSRAATASSDVTVNATILPEVSFNFQATECRAGASVTDGELGIDAAGQRLTIAATGNTVLGTCRMRFGTNNGASGASLSVSNQRPAGNVIMCGGAAGAACSGGSFADDDGANATLEAGRFGIRADTLTCTTAAWTAGRYYGAPDAPATDNICTGQTADPVAANDGDVTVGFVTNGNNQPSGNYYARMAFTATAN